MTGMPSGRPSEPRTGPAAPAPAHGDGPTGPSAPTGHTALRDRIAEALHATLIALATRSDATTNGAASYRVLADAVLPIVEDAIAPYRMQVDDPDSLLTALDQAERERDQARDAIADERRGRLTAEAAVRRVKHVLAWKTLLAGPQAERAVRVADVEAALDAEQPKETRKPNAYDANRELFDELDRETKAASAAMNADDMDAWNAHAGRAAHLHREIAERLGWNLIPPRYAEETR